MFGTGIEMGKALMGLGESVFVDRKSEFLGFAAPVFSEKEAAGFLSDIKSRHKTARHHCYAYIIEDNNISRFSDNGEPGGTAGVQIYETLRRHELTNAICVVVRYFGGTLLGTGGLTRAYRTAAAEAVESSGVREVYQSRIVKLRLDYNNYSRAEKFIGQYADVSEITLTFGEDVLVELPVKTEASDGFIKAVTEICGGKIVIS
ncbi:YigZ family protein [Clostridia bacterium]|nr:YigZ family protein [Clostridia bacterium]